MFRHLSLMVKNAARNRRRSLLTIASVAASLCLLGVMMAIYHAFYLTPETPSQALRIVTRHRVSITNVMPVAYRETIRKIPGVRETVVTMWFGGVYKEPKNMFGRMAVEPDRFFTVYPEYTKLAAGSVPDFQRERSACILGKATAEKFGLKVGDRMTLVGDIFPVTLDFTIRAIFDVPADNDSMYFNMEYLYQSLGAGRRDFAGLFISLADAPEHVPAIAAAIDDHFRNAPHATRSESEKAFQLGFISFLGNVKGFLFSICAAVTFTILLVTGNTMAMSVRERVREIGVLKTLGYTNQAILGMVLGESAVLSLIGGVIGCGLADGLCYFVRQLPGFFAELKTLTIVPEVMVALLVVAILIGIASAFVPAWNASRTNILDALRYTG